MDECMTSTSKEYKYYFHDCFVLLLTDPVKALLATMNHVSRVIQVVGVELILDTIQCESSVCNPVSKTANDGTHVYGISFIAYKNKNITKDNLRPKTLDWEPVFGLVVGVPEPLVDMGT